MPGNPKFDRFTKVKIATKFEKSTDHNHKLNSSEGGQDTSACKISGHSLHAFSGKCPKTPNLTRFTKSKWHQKEQNLTDHDHNLISSEGGQDTSACKISSHYLIAFPRKPLRTDGRRTDGRTDGQATKRSRLVGWTDGPMYRREEGISGFGRTGGRTGGRTTRTHNASGA